MRSPDDMGPTVDRLEPGENVRAIYGVAGKRLRSFRDPSKGKFLELDVQDQTGTIPGKIWSGAETMADIFSVGDVVWVTARVDEYRGQAQLIIEDLERVDVEGIPMERFIPSAPRNLRDMEEELWRYIESVGQPHLSQLLLVLFQQEQFYERFTTSPAAKKVHHDYLHGLLEHSLEVVSILTETSVNRPGLDDDLLVAGGLLHDVGKVRELACGGCIDYTDEGRLVGHIVIGHEIISSAVENIPDFPEGLALHLRHILLSHHGKLEYGSPVLPQTREAVAVHHADLMSGKVGQVMSVGDRAGNAESGWSDYDRLLGRYIWIPPSSEVAATGEEADCET